MATHSDEYRVRAMASALGRGAGAWGACPELPDVLCESVIRACADLRTVLDCQGQIVAQLLGGAAWYSGFRVLARDVRTGALAGSVEWRRAGTGRWEVWDAPVTVCEYGQHRPARPTHRLGLVA